MRKTKNLETLKGLQCVCPVPSYRAGLDYALSLTREFLRENCGGYLDELELHIDEDGGNLVVAWSIRTPIDELTYAARTFQDIAPAQTVLARALPPDDVSNIRIQMHARIPMFEVNPQTGFADGQKMRPDFADALKAFAAGREDAHWKIRDSILKPISQSFIKAK